MTASNPAMGGSDSASELCPTPAGEDGNGHKHDATDISAVRELLSTDDNAECSDAMISRYLRAVGNDTRHAARRLHTTLTWWLTEGKPSEMICPACPQDPGSHYMHCACYDLTGRPVIYSCMDLASNKSIEDNRSHMIATFEAAIEFMPPGVEQWSWVLDFHGFSLRDCDPRLARVFLHLAADHYPERLGHFFIVDPPALFHTLWRAVSRFIDPKTKSKIAWLSLKRRDELEVELGRHCDVETVQWLVEEMLDNRKAGRRGMKHYPYAAMAELLETKTGGVPELSSEEHSNMGAPGFLSFLASRSGRVPSQYRAHCHRHGDGDDGKL